MTIEKQHSNNYSRLGVFVNGKLEGVGSHAQSDGLLYIGEFKDGDYNGYGKGTIPGRKTLCGIWKDGHFVEELPHRDKNIMKVLSTHKAMEKKYKEAQQKASKRVKDTGEYLYNADPNCEHNIVAGDNYSGVKCSKCTGWYCE